MCNQGNCYFNVRSERNVLLIVVIFRFLVSMLTQSIQFNSLTTLVCFIGLVFCFLLVLKYYVQFV